MKSQIQKLGGFLSGIIMPIIGSFIAWGIITALFIPDGWFPNETFAMLVGPMITYLLPILIGYSGGKLVYEDRGGVIGAIATMGVVVSSDIPMFLGAMIIGPLAAVSIRAFDRAVDGKVKTGFEMLVNNYSLGIIAAILAIVGIVVVSPIVNGFTEIFGSGVEYLVNNSLLFLTSVIIEPAKVLFLNNAINHGVLTPLGSIDVEETGKSILFLLEANPGPGLGILLAYSFFGKGNAKATAPGAIIIHFFGGIHEIYFPYILMKPALIIAAIAGGMSGVFTFSILGAGLVAPASPGSIFAISAMAPKGGLLPVLAGVLVATAVSFLVASIILKASKETMDLDSATKEMEAMKGKKSSVATVLASDKNIKTIVFACDAGMGSSAMGASLLRNLAKEAGMDYLDITNRPLKKLDNKIDLVVTQEQFESTANSFSTDSEKFFVSNFLDKDQYRQLLESIKTRNEE
ncbi:PTS mannitol transporter subunit IICBA [Mollicutes bacterium LVI A0039]|nr:PTS mannitol transporter subunit IICBA [Mollicutes bacterium LVI A0039]